MKRLTVLFILLILAICLEQPLCAESECVKYQELFSYSEKKFEIDMGNGCTRLVFQLDWNCISEFHDGSTYRYENLDSFNSTDSGTKGAGIGFTYSKSTHELFMVNNCGTVYELLKGNIKKAFKMPASYLASFRINSFCRICEGFAFHISPFGSDPSPAKLLCVYDNGKVCELKETQEKPLGSRMVYIPQNNTIVIDRTTGISSTAIAPLEFTIVYLTTMSINSITSKETSKRYSGIHYVSDGIYFVRGYLVNISSGDFLNVDTYKDVFMDTAYEEIFEHSALHYVNENTFISFSYNYTLRSVKTQDTDDLRELLIHPKCPVDCCIYSFIDGALKKTASFQFVYSGTVPRISEVFYDEDNGTVFCDDRCASLIVDIKNDKLIDLNQEMTPVACESGMIMVGESGLVCFSTPWANLYKIRKVKGLPDSYQKCVSFDRELYFIAQNSLTTCEFISDKVTTVGVEREYVDICVNATGIYLIDKDMEAYHTDNINTPAVKLKDYKKIKVSSGDGIMLKSEKESKYLFVSRKDGNTETNCSYGKVETFANGFLVMNEANARYVLSLPQKARKELPAALSGSRMLYSQNNATVFTKDGKIMLYDWSDATDLKSWGKIEPGSSIPSFFVVRSILNEASIVAWCNRAHVGHP